jgi:saccharopine dehydrogenase-like NADP-dependent oxidoreductase
MKSVIVLGAGNSAPSLITYLLDHAEENNWSVTVGDLDVNAAIDRIGDHPCGYAIEFNVLDKQQLKDVVRKADIVVNFLAPAFQAMVAEECIKQKSHMVSASYQSPEIKKLNDKAKDAGVLILNEMGLDPGIDLMSAMEIIERVRKDNGVVKKFISYGSGIPSPDHPENPLNYIITWNPHNVAIAGSAGAQYLENGKIKIVPYHRIFKTTWEVDVEGVGITESYLNRDSLGYIDQFGLDGIETMIRATLRHTGYCEVWNKIIKIGLTNTLLPIPDLEKYSMADIVEMLLPTAISGLDLKSNVAARLDISSTGTVMGKLEALGLFSEEIIGFKGSTPADALTTLLTRKLPLDPTSHDMVILVHDMVIEYPDDNNRRENIVSTFVQYGTTGGDTGMAKTVGIPAAIATKMILRGEMDLTGTIIPLIPEVYVPVLKELEDMGMSFSEKIVKM